MHGLPCSALRHCFSGPAEVVAEPTPSLDRINSRPDGTSLQTPTVDLVLSQPVPDVNRPVDYPHQRRVSYISTQTRSVNGIHPSSDCCLKEIEEPCFQTPVVLHSPPVRSAQEGLDGDLDEDVDLDVELNLGFGEEPGMMYPHIPRPSIIRQSRVSSEGVREIEFVEKANERRFVFYPVMSPV